MQDINLKPIGVVHSPYKQKFAIPRQPNLVPTGRGTIELFSDFTDLNCLRGIEHFSHLWVLFFFHATAERGWSSTVQPPRLGGRRKVGVFASRSPFRPNPIGISVLKYRDHVLFEGKVCIEVQGIDILDGTPVFDIKPYIPYADALEDANGSYANTKPAADFEVSFTNEVEYKLKELEGNFPKLKTFISQVLSQDPRPPWRAKYSDSKQYGMTLFDFNIKWEVQTNQILVNAIHALQNDKQKQHFAIGEDSVK